MDRELTVSFADDFIEETIENPIPIKDLLKQSFIQYVNQKKGYTYIIDNTDSYE